MSEVEYIHLPSDAAIPRLEVVSRKVIVLADDPVSDARQARVCEWIVHSGCRYFMAWGHDCEGWHDEVDTASLQRFDWKVDQIPEDEFVYTTWHNDEPKSEVFWYSHHCAEHPTLDLSQTIIIHIAEKADRDGVLRSYEEAK